MPFRRLKSFLILLLLNSASLLVLWPSSALAGSLWVEDWGTASRPPPPNQGLPPTDRWNFHTYNLWVLDENGDPVPGDGTTDSYSFMTNPAPYGETLVMLGNSWGLESKQHFQRGAPLSVESYVKIDSLTPNTGSFAGITVYTGESKIYEEIALYDDCPTCNNDLGNLKLYRFTEDTMQPLATPHLDPILNHNLRYKLRLDYDGQGNWRYYIEDVEVGFVENRPLDSAPNIFILGVASRIGEGFPPLGDPDYRIRAEFSGIKVAANYNLFSRTSWVDFLDGVGTENIYLNTDTNNFEMDDEGLPVCPWPGLGYPQCDFIQLAEDPESGAFHEQGYIVTPEISRPVITEPGGPDLSLTWGEAFFNAALNQYGDVTIQVLDKNGGLIPDSVLSGNGLSLGNGYGFRSSPITLSGLDPAVYDRIRLRANLSTSNTGFSPWLLDWTLTFGKKSYFSWYDMQTEGMRDWLLMSNPTMYSTGAHFESVLGGGASRYDAADPGESVNRVFPGMMDGPLMVNSLTGLPQMISQRVLYNDSLEETIAIPEERLSNVYNWTWYDMQTPGYKDWIVIANPDESRPVYYQISMPGIDAGTPGATGVIPPGGRAAPVFAGIMGGPVRLEAWAADPLTGAPISGTSAKVIASQRVLMFDDTSFNEVNGIPASELSDRYLWTWYDSGSEGAKNWVLAANPNDAPVDYQINIAGGCDEEPLDSSRCQYGTLMPVNDAEGRDRVTAIFPGQMGGPVEVTSSGGNVIASQRVLWGESFEEVPGYRFDALSSDYHWTWYDQLSANSRNWVVVTNNPDTEDVVTVQVLIEGVTLGYYDLEPGETVTPAFPLFMGGPVEVRAFVNGGDYAVAADRRDVLASQRVLWSGKLNEVEGTVIDP